MYVCIGACMMYSSVSVWLCMLVVKPRNNAINTIGLCKDIFLVVKSGE